VTNIEVQAVGPELEVPLEKVSKGASVGGSKGIASSIGSCLALSTKMD
jgi:hypothetical protein